MQLHYLATSLPKIQRLPTVHLLPTIGPADNKLNNTQNPLSNFVTQVLSYAVFR